MFLKNEIRKEIGFEFPENTCFEKRAGDLKIVKENGKITVYYEKERQLVRSALLIKAYGEEGDFCITEKTDFNDLCFMIDCSRNGVLNVDTAKKIIRNLALLGYDSMMLYTEDTYEVDGAPAFGYLRGRYTKEEIKEIDAYAQKFGIELIPCIQTLAHLQALRRWYVDFEELFDCDDILMAGDERVYALIEKIFKTLSECFSSRRVHIGMDEAHNVGRGQYMDVNGYRETFDVLSEHLERVGSIAAKYGFSALMWSDMFWKIAMRTKERLDENGNVLIPQWVLDKIPENVTVSHWDYGWFKSEAYEHKFRMHMDFKNPAWFALSSYKCGGFAPANGLSEHEFTTGFEMSRKYNIRSLINCSWSDGGNEASIFSILPAIVDFTARAYNKTETERDKEFLALTGYERSEFMKIEWADTFCGKYTKDNVSVTKVMLYNDLFLGQLDTEVDPEGIANFKRTIEELKKIPDGQYAHIFQTVAALTEVHVLKYDMGIRLRKAYKSGDKKTLHSIVSEIDQLLEKLQAFIPLLRKQWMLENKPHGFDIQEYRLGGVNERIKGCKLRLLAYLAGEIESIPELEETLIPDVLLGRNAHTGRMGYNSFELIASVNKF